MRRMNLALCCYSCWGSLCWGSAPVVAGQKVWLGGGAPKPDGKFRAMTTSIAPNMGVTWADAG